MQLDNVSLKNVLCMAYKFKQDIENASKDSEDANKDSKDADKDSEDADKVAKMNYTDVDLYNNHKKKLKPIINGLYCLINDSDDVDIETSLNILTDDLNIYNQCIIFAVMTMKSSRNSSFISKLVQHQFSEITADDKRDYTNYVFSYLKEFFYNVPIDDSDEEFSVLYDSAKYGDGFKVPIKERKELTLEELESLSKKVMERISKKQFFLFNNDSEYTKEKEVSEQEINEIKEAVRESKWEDTFFDLYSKILDSLKYEERIEKTCDDLTIKIKDSINEIIGFDARKNIIAPSSFFNSYTPNNINDRLSVEIAGEYMAIDLLNDEERMCMLDSLQLHIEKALKAWQNDVSTALQRKIDNFDFFK